MTKTWRELGIDRDEIEAAIRHYTIRPDANIDAGGMRTIIESGRHQGDYASWWAKQDKAFQINAVGPGRYELLKSGKISFGELVDDMGRQRPMAELLRIIEGKQSVGADVIFKDRARSLGLEAPLKIKKWGPDNSLTSVVVEYTPRVGSLKFEILKDGSPVIYGDPAWAQNMDSLNRIMLKRSIHEFMSPLGDDVYIRVTNKKADYDFLKTGKHRGSKNWATGEAEHGLSVAKSPEFSGEYAYYVRGKRIADGSDGEPVLDVLSARPAGKLMKYSDLVKEYEDALYKYGSSLGLTEDEVRALMGSSRAVKKGHG